MDQNDDGSRTKVRQSDINRLLSKSTRPRRLSNILVGHARAAAHGAWQRTRSGRWGKVSLDSKGVNLSPNGRPRSGRVENGTISSSNPLYRSPVNPNDDEDSSNQQFDTSRPVSSSNPLFNDEANSAPASDPMVDDDSNAGVNQNSYNSEPAENDMEDAVDQDSDGGLVETKTPYDLLVCPANHPLHLMVSDRVNPWCNTCTNRIALMNMWQNLFRLNSGLLFGCHECLFYVCLPKCYETFYKGNDWVEFVLENPCEKWEHITSFSNDHETWGTVVYNCLWYTMLRFPGKFINLVNKMLVSSLTQLDGVGDMDVVMSRMFSVYCSVSCEAAPVVREFWLNQLHNPASLVDPTFDENRPVRMAARNGDIELLDYLLKIENVDPSAHDNYALMKAGEYGFSAVIRLLLSHPSVDPEPHQNGALQFAVKNGHLEAAKTLLECSRLRFTQFCIAQASRNGDLDMVKLIEEHVGFHPEALYQACRFGQINVVEYFLNETNLSAQIANVLHVCLHHSLRAPTTEVMERLLEEPIENFRRNDNILSAAVSSGVDKVKILLNHPLITQDHFSHVPMSSAPLVTAVSLPLDEGLEVAKLLIEDSRVDLSVGAPLIHAANCGNVECVNLLLRDGRVDPNQTRFITGHARNALEVSASAGHLNVVRALLADPRVKFGESILDFAVISTRVEVVNELLALLKPEQCTRGAIAAASRWWLQLVSAKLPFAMFGEALEKIAIEVEEDPEIVHFMVQNALQDDSDSDLELDLHMGFHPMFFPNRYIPIIKSIMEKCFEVPDTTGVGIPMLDTTECLEHSGSENQLSEDELNDEDSTAGSEATSIVEEDHMSHIGLGFFPATQAPTPLWGRRSSSLPVSDSKHILFRATSPVVQSLTLEYEFPIRLQGVMYCAMQAGKLGVHIPGHVLFELLEDWCSAIYFPRPRSEMNDDIVDEKINQIVKRIHSTSVELHPDVQHV